MEVCLFKTKIGAIYMYLNVQVDCMNGLQHTVYCISYSVLSILF